VQIAADKGEMDKIEQAILKLLADSKGDILEDDKLIKTLAKSSDTGAAIGERMKDAEIAMAEIERVTEALRPCALRASILYFCIAEMGAIDPMYQYSLEFFNTLFSGRLEKSEKSEDLQTRINIILEDVTRNVYLSICRGLFEDHKMIFSFMIIAKILRSTVHSEFMGKTPISDLEWAFMLRGIEAGKGIIDTTASGTSGADDDDEDEEDDAPKEAAPTGPKKPDWMPTVAF
jgi:dynein heavy chain